MEPLNNDIRIRTVHQTSKSTFTHETTGIKYHVTDYDVYFSIKGEEFYVSMQTTLKDGAEETYLMTAYLDRAMAVYFKVPVNQMGKDKKKNRKLLADKILTLALKKLGG